MRTSGALALVGLGAILVQGAWSPDVPYLWRISSLVIFGITVLAVSALIGLVLGTPLYRVAVALGVVSSLTLGPGPLSRSD